MYPSITGAPTIDERPDSRSPHRSILSYFSLLSIYFNLVHSIRRVVILPFVLSLYLFTFQLFLVRNWPISSSLFFRPNRASAPRVNSVLLESPA